MKRISLVFLFLTACVGLPDGSTSVPEPAWNEATPSLPGIIATNTPTNVGTWETVIEGQVFDISAGADKPIEGATITYDVLHTYFPGLQEGRSNRTTSDAHGYFSLSVVVHDTDSIRILVEATGYLPFEQEFTGFDLVAGKRIMAGLSR